MLLILQPSRAQAGGGWIDPPGSFYLKASVSSLRSESYHANDGHTVRTAEFSDLTLGVYAECGLWPRLAAEVDLPLLRRHSFPGAEPVSGPGDIGIGLKYGIATGSTPLAVGVTVEIPTGDRDAFGRNLLQPESIIRLPTGDGEWNAWARIHASHSFSPAPAYMSIDAGYNIRTRGLTDQYRAGVSGGYRPIERLALSGGVRRMGTVGAANPSLVYSAVGIGEGVAYTAWDLGLAYGVVPSVSVTADLSSAFGGVRNLYGGTVVTLGVAIRR